MSIAGKHWYRFEFLKSDEWRDFRLQIITDCCGKCFCCGLTDPSNEARQFVVLCRGCHEMIHKLVLPTGAKNESARELAWKRFDTARLIIKGKYKCGSWGHFRRIGLITGSNPFCRGCFSTVDLLLIDPIRQVEMAKGSVKSLHLCRECFADIKLHFPQHEHGSARQWREILRFLSASRIKLAKVSLDKLF